MLMSLTGAVAPVDVERVVRGAAALGSGRRGQAQVGAHAVVLRALVGAVLPRAVKDADVHAVLQVVLHHGAVQAAALVGALDAALVQVRPVDVVAVLRQAERVGQVVRHNLAVLAWRGVGVGVGGW